MNKMRSKTMCMGSRASLRRLSKNTFLPELVGKKIKDFVEPSQSLPRQNLNKSCGLFEE